jgi:hypothetical protein
MKKTKNYDQLSKLSTMSDEIKKKKLQLAECSSDFSLYFSDSDSECDNELEDDSCVVNDSDSSYCEHKYTLDLDNDDDIIFKNLI